MADCIVMKGGSGGVDCDNSTATASDIRAGKTAGIAGNDEIITGTLKDNGAVIKEIAAGESYSGDGIYSSISITARDLASQTAGTATAADILNGKTSTVGGTLITGSMPNRGAVSQALNAGSSYNIPAGYHNGSGKVSANSLASQTSATASAGHILSGKTAWANGSKLTGSMANVGATDQRKSIAVNGSNLYVRMTNGAHVTNASSGYPEVSVPMSDFGAATAAQVLIGKTFTSSSGLKIIGTMPDYSSGRTSFNGATFDGTLLTGVASGQISINYNYITDLKASISFQMYSSKAYIAFNPSVNLTPFSSISVTVTMDGVVYEKDSCNVKPFVLDANGEKDRNGNRVLSNSRTILASGYVSGSGSLGTRTITIDTSKINTDCFLMIEVNASVGVGDYYNFKLNSIVFNN